MKNLLRRRFLPAILCMALALGLSACGGKDTPPVETETDGAMGTLSGSKGEKDSGVGVFSGSFRVPLPGKEYMAIRLTRV